MSENKAQFSLGSFLLGLVVGAAAPAASAVCGAAKAGMLDSGSDSPNGEN